MRRYIARLTALLSVVCCGLAVLLGAAPAEATTTPSVSLHPTHRQISATGHTTFGYRAAHLRRGSHVALQVQEQGHWVDIARTGSRQGTVSGTFRVTGPGEPGKFSFRAAIARRGRTVATSGRHAVYAFGRVSLDALCHGVLDGDCDSGVQHLDDGSSFHYVLSTGINEPTDPFSAEIGAAKIACRSITLSYISDSPDGTNTYLELRQPGSKKQKHISSSKQVGHFKATLTGKAFGVSVEQDAAQVLMYFNGYASCYSATGRP